MELEELPEDIQEFVNTMKHLSHTQECCIEVGVMNGTNTAEALELMKAEITEEMNSCTETLREIEHFIKHTTGE